MHPEPRIAEGDAKTAADSAAIHQRLTTGTSYEFIVAPRYALPNSTG
jgi:hypothetical protein